MTTGFSGTRARVRAALAGLRGAGHWHVTAVLLGGCFMLAAHAANGNDPYLQAINAEGNRLESLGKARQEHERLERLQSIEKKGAAAAPAPTAAATATSLQGFENALRDNFPGSYALYALMDSTEKNQVYAEYQKKKSDGPARFIPVVVRIIAITNGKRAPVSAK